MEFLRRGSVASVLLAVAYVVLAWPCLRENSATYDETAFVPAGYSYVTRGDFRLGADHPPLLKALAALPLLPLAPVVGAQAETAFAAAARDVDAQWLFGDRFLYADNAPHELLFRARLVVLLFGAALVVLVYAAARRVFAPSVALLCGALAALDPNLLAHGSLATTDVGATALLFGAVLLAAAAIARPRPSVVAGATLVGGAALSAKFTCLLLLPIVAVLVLLRVIGAGAVASLRVRAAVAVLSYAAWAAGCVGVLWASYGFRYAASATGATELPIEVTASHIRGMQVRGELLDAGRPLPERAVFDRLVEQKAVGLTERAIRAGARWHLLPEAYLFGLAYATKWSEARASFLLGAFSERGWFGYFPIALATKMPLATLCSVVAGLALLAHRASRRRLRGSLAWLLVPIVVIGGTVVASHLNIGVRHVLPIYPFLLVVAGLAFDALRRWRGWRGLCVGGLLVLATAAETLAARPYFLPFFHVAAGGGRGGLDILSDSNLDWGQGLPALRSWMREHGVARVNLCYFGTADPSAWGIVCTPCPGSYAFALPGVGSAGVAPRMPELPGWIAIGATHLQGTYLPAALRARYAALRRLTPAAVLGGGAIYVYWVERW